MYPSNVSKSKGLEKIWDFKDSSIPKMMANKAIGVIHKGFNPDIFEQFYNLNLDYDLTDRGDRYLNALSKAAYVGNADLVARIIKIGGSGLVNITNEHGWTALFCACLCKSGTRGCRIAKILLKNGSSLNVTVFNHSRQSIPLNATPLWAAAEKTANLRLIACLIINRGTVDDSLLSLKGREAIALVMNLLIERSKILYYNSKETSFGALPSDVIATMKRLSARLFLKKYKIK